VVITVVHCLFCVVIIRRCNLCLVLTTLISVPHPVRAILWLLQLQSFHCMLYCSFHHFMDISLLSQLVGWHET